MPCSKPIVTCSSRSGASCGARHRPGGWEGRVRSVFQLATLMAHVPQIAVAGMDLLPACRHRNTVRLCVVQAVLAALQRPLTPRRDHLQLRRQRLVGMLEAHLVIALAGAAVCDRSSAFGQRDLHLMLCDDGPSNRGAE